jgi:hypothetical protein
MSNKNQEKEYLGWEDEPYVFIRNEGSRKGSYIILTFDLLLEV